MVGMVKITHKIGSVEFTLSDHHASKESFNEWKDEFLSIPETKKCKVWLTGGFLESWTTVDIDIVLTGDLTNNEIKKLLSQGRVIGAKYNIMIDICHWDKEPIYIYEKYPHAWGIGKWKEYDKEVRKKVVNIKKLNLSDSYYINGKLVKKVHGAKKVDDGLYEMNYIYPTIKQESREYKSKPILLNEH
jgi:hypothetical protein